MPCPESTPPLCACGCGQPVKRYKNRWMTYAARNHHVRKYPITPALCASGCGNEVPRRNRRNGPWQTFCSRRCATLTRGHSTHRMSHSPEYRVWHSMKTRCHTPGTKDYPKYGAMGITVCARWRESFESFYADMGPRPSLKHTIDRINNMDGYHPNNCRWATAIEQGAHYKTTRQITHNGMTLSLAGWSRVCGLDRATLRHRIKLGLDLEDVFSLSPAPSIRLRPRANKTN